LVASLGGAVDTAVMVAAEPAAIFAQSSHAQPKWWTSGASASEGSPVRPVTTTCAPALSASTIGRAER